MEESALRSIPLFESLDREHRRVIAQHAEEMDIAEGTELVRQGEFAYEFFVLETGSAEVRREGDVVAVLGPGDFFGEMGIVAKTVRNATVVTTSDARVIVMTEQDFRMMSRTSPEVADRIRAAVESFSRAS
jgi:CRP/FNR family cyclic AMP-dependent transcriptional regulator